MTDSLAHPTGRHRGQAHDAMPARPRRPARLLETCAVCGGLFDLRTQPARTLGRHCSTACLTTARRILSHPGPAPMIPDRVAPPGAPATAA